MSFKDEQPPGFEIVSRKSGMLVETTNDWNKAKEYLKDPNYHVKMPDGSWFPDDYLFE